MDKLTKLKNRIKDSAFNRLCYSVTVDLLSFHRNLQWYSESYTSEFPESEILKHVVPCFQRNNNKWSQDRKICFMENLLSGYPVEIYLYTLNYDMKCDCKIIDGLQRCTAIDDWFNNKYPVFGDIYFKDLQGMGRKPFMHSRLSLCIYGFDSEKEAVKFYIDINKGITHSEEDIGKAYDYLKTLGE